MGQSTNGNSRSKLLSLLDKHAVLREADGSGSKWQVLVGALENNRAILLSHTPLTPGYYIVRDAFPKGDRTCCCTSNGAELGCADCMPFAFSPSRTSAWCTRRCSLAVCRQMAQVLRASLDLDLDLEFASEDFTQHTLLQPEGGSSNGDELSECDPLADFEAALREENVSIALPPYSTQASQPSGNPEQNQSQAAASPYDSSSAISYSIDHLAGVSKKVAWKRKSEKVAEVKGSAAPISGTVVRAF